MSSSDPDALAKENAALRAQLEQALAAVATKEKEIATKAEEIATKEKEIATKAEEIATKEKEIAKLKKRLDDLAKQLFGVKAERVDPAQLRLGFLEAVEAGVEPPPFASPPEPAAPEEKRRRKGKRNGRVKLPADLPREQIVHEPDPEDRVCACCGKPMRKIGQEVTEVLDFRPASFVVREHVRPKYACGADCSTGVVCASLPPMPIERGRPGPGLLAEVIVRKYGDHLPLERQSGIFAREGVEISKQTLCDWVAAMAHDLSPIYRAMRERVLASPIVQTDETGLRVLRNKHSKKRKGNVWVCAGKPGELFYAYTMTKESKAIQKLFQGFQGYLQADAYPGFDCLYREETVVEVGCHAHARRRFVKAYEKGEAHAAWALAAYKQLYAVECEAREGGLSPEARRQLREARSRPVLESFFAWLEGLRESLRPSSLLADAVRYALNQRDALWRFLDDGRLEIDNNRSERTLRKVALGRNNYLFAGSPKGAETAMVHYTLVWACKEIGVNPAEYLRDVISRLHTHPNSEIEKLFPVEWKAARARPDTS